RRRGASRFRSAALRSTRSGARATRCRHRRAAAPSAGCEVTGRSSARRRSARTVPSVQHVLSASLVGPALDPTWAARPSLGGRTRTGGTMVGVDRVERYGVGRSGAGGRTATRLERGHQADQEGEATGDPRRPRGGGAVVEAECPGRQEQQGAEGGGDPGAGATGAEERPPGGHHEERP